MAISSQTKDFLREARRTGPSHYKTLPDELLYWELDRKGKTIPPEARWEEESYQIAESIKPQKTEDLGFFANLADWWVDDNSYEWMKAAYNRSITGTTEKLLQGESRYDVDEADFNILQDIGATVFSFLMPLDIITMGAGGFIGGKAANAALKKGLFQGAKSKAATQEAIRQSERAIGKKIGTRLTKEGIEGKTIGEVVKKAQSALN